MAFNNNLLLLLIVYQYLTDEILARLAVSLVWMAKLIKNLFAFGSSLAESD